MTNNGNRRDFMATALARYIDECEPEGLHEDCCFRRETPEGIAACGRECDAHLRQFLTAPFDAGKSAMLDGGLPNASWSTVSLLRFCSQHLCRNPMLRSQDDFGVLSPHKSQVLVTNSLALLDSRGVDPEQLLRGPFGEVVADNIMISASMPTPILRPATK